MAMSQANLRVLITGLNGMLGQQLAESLPSFGIEVVGATSRQFNLLETLEALKTKLDDLAPVDAIVHAAAYTNVDGAEANPELAMAINKEGTHKMALLARLFDVPLVYISTDYVFDGQQAVPYTPQDKPNPINVYGLSKYYGELMVTEHLDKYFILRTSWVYGEHKANFVTKVLSHAKLGQQMPVFQDQYGSPTWTGTLARLIANALRSDVYGTYHACDKGAITRFEQAKVISEMAGLNTDHLIPVATSSVQLPAKRPLYSVLDPGTLPTTDWRDGLKHCLERLQTTSGNKI